MLGSPEDVRIPPALAPGPGRADRRLAAGGELVEQVPADSLQTEARVARFGDCRNLPRIRGTRGRSAEVVVEGRDHQDRTLVEQRVRDAGDQTEVGLRVRADDLERAVHDAALLVDLVDGDLRAGQIRLVIEADDAGQGQRHRDHDRLAGETLARLGRASAGEREQRHQCQRGNDDDSQRVLHLCSSS